MSLISSCLLILALCCTVSWATIFGVGNRLERRRPGDRIFNPGRRGHIDECFRCSYYDCISMSHVCDGWDDCPSGLDEDGCEKVCPYPDYYRCSDSKTCMDSYHVCDGRNDCPNGEDEAYYQCNLYTATGREERMATQKKALSYSLALEDIHLRDSDHPSLNGSSSSATELPSRS